MPPPYFSEAPRSSSDGFVASQSNEQNLGPSESGDENLPPRLPLFPESQQSGWTPPNSFTPEKLALQCLLVSFVVEAY